MTPTITITITIAPVRKSIRVKASQAHAFEVFTSGLARWWPSTHSIGTAPLKTVVMETRLGGRQWMMDDDYTIADISMLGWVRNLTGFYGARELVEFDTFRQVRAWLERGLARPAVQRGLEIPKRP